MTGPVPPQSTAGHGSTLFLVKSQHISGTDPEWEPSWPHTLTPIPIGVKV